ncbi:MAG: prefoldin subunit beta [Candidatus Woesearchaeota archaeon]|jgi:prefoldin beta subunit|nr:prefoldin subunit beta [Candidatus Woesearchaeota archaeon]MDP7323540.1 prefoldin subunit beta [Candidatus Woesearchaeota archaeon]
MAEETDGKIQKLQLLEQNAQQLLAQRQQFQNQLIEVESALTEIKKTNSAYKIIGNIMVAASKDDLTKDLNEKKEMMEIRVKTFEKQENDIKVKAKNLQEEVLKEMEKKK